MQSSEIRKRFLAFFEKRGHAVLPSASLVPQNDPSVLFNTAGMQPLVPYLLGQKHPAGDKLVNIQKCVRTGDLDDIGDRRHLSFFQMMGNWSLGSYFKQEAISWSYEFLTSPEEGLGLDPNRLYVTCFEGDENAPRDEESPEIWKSLGIPEHRIYFLGAEDNWWSPGDNGPCGPDSEMFYDMTEAGLGDLSKEDFLAAQKTEDIIEIWNDVFMEYEKKDGKVVGKLAQKNVDTGAGLERIAAVMQKKATAYDTDLFEPIVRYIRQHSTDLNVRAERIVADHIRASVFMIADGVVPANTGRGYVLRRLIRRAVRFSDVLGMPEGTLTDLFELVREMYVDAYPELASNSLLAAFTEEESKFRKKLEQGLKEFEKGTDPFILATTYGFPIELTLELAQEQGKTIDIDDFKKKMTEHQELSRTSSTGMFKGGLGDTSEMSLRYHTATHLLNAALKRVLGEHVKQRGSNITPERLRFDFSHSAKVTDEEKEKITALMNEWVSKGLVVTRQEMPREEAEKMGAEMEFGAKYPDIVSVYSIRDTDDTPISMEFCGGPHVENTGTLGVFSIQKEEASSAGVRRIKAILS
ncbi:MAG: hypothetical protein RLY47_171 [Candidatus Parcubacteria bacterium]|jgi:alanyl-tRNA synthetase